MSVQFKAEKSLNVAGMKMIPIRTDDDEGVFVKASKCFSFGVRKDTKFGAVSMSLVLEEESLKTLKNIVKECESHLGRPLTKRLFYGEYGNQWRSQPDSLVPLCKFQVIFKLLSLFISLEINCFHSQ